MSWLGVANFLCVFRKFNSTSHSTEIDTVANRGASLLPGSALNAKVLKVATRRNPEILSHAEFIMATASVINPAVRTVQWFG